MSFLFFCEFLLNEKSEVKLFSAQKKRIEKGIQRCRIHRHLIFNKGTMTV
jgi:hypothetical protein